VLGAIDLVWANYFHLSYNAYLDRIPEEAAENPALRDAVYAPRLRWDHELWEDLTRQIVEAGGNMIVLSLGDGIKYDGHPEIVVDGAWTPAELKREIARLSDLGIEVVPELNFSTTHDIWLGPYHRMISTPQYYEVCADLIAEVVEIFDRPRFFHLGFDEETLEQQHGFNYVVLRQHDLWWHDLLWFIEQVESHGVRPWVWSDAIWSQSGQFVERMPKSVVQSNWYYGERFDLSAELARLAERAEGAEAEIEGELIGYLDLAAGGFDQIPTGSTFFHERNFPETVQFAQQHLPEEQVIGFMQTTWRPMLERYRDDQERGIALFAEGKRLYDPAGWAIESD
jgi:hypothetical protein